MTPKQQELLDKQTSLAALKQWRTTLVSIQSELQRMLDMLPRRRDRFQHNQADELTRALRYVEIGLAKQNGVAFEPFPIMKPMVGKPGLEETNLRIEILEDECADLRDYVKLWPNASATNQFRYIGRPEKTTIEGRWLEPGDVVTLNETQAHAMRDRFEVVQ